MNSKNQIANRGLYRRRLPHFSDSSLPQFITFRLYDSVPEKLLKKWQDLIDVTDPQTSVLYRKKVERFLDRGYGECFLKRKEVAVKMRDSLFFHDGKKYKIIAWVIMPNHVHILLQPMDGIELEEITHSIKSYT